MKPTVNIKTMEITLTRTIPASPEETFDGWLDPENPGTPWHSSDKIVFDRPPRVDGLFYFLHMLDNGTHAGHFGRFDVIERPTKLRYTWMSPFTRGLESVVTVTFKRKGEDTLLTLNHANLPDDELGRAHDGGWTHLIGILEERFAKVRT